MTHAACKLHRRAHKRPTRSTEALKAKLAAAEPAIREMRARGIGIKPIAKLLGIAAKNVAAFLKERDMPFAINGHNRPLPRIGRKTVLEQRIDRELGETAAMAWHVNAVKSDAWFAKAMNGRRFDSYHLGPAGRLHLRRPDPADGMGATPLA